MGLLAAGRALRPPPFTAAFGAAEVSEDLATAVDWATSVEPAPTAFRVADRPELFRGAWLSASAGRDGRLGFGAAVSAFSAAGSFAFGGRGVAAG